MNKVAWVFLFLSVPSVLHAEAGKESAGWVVEVTGKAYLEVPDLEKLALAADSKIFEGSNLLTESGAKLRVMFIDESIIDIGESSKVFVKRTSKKDDQVELVLESGTMRALVRKRISLKNADSGLPKAFRVKTKAVTMGVRGTDFYVRSFSDAKAESVYCAVNSGRVGISVQGETRPRELAPGGTITVNTVNLPGQPPGQAQVVQAQLTSTQKEFINSPRAFEVPPATAEKGVPQGMPPELAPRLEGAISGHGEMGHAEPGLVESGGRTGERPNAPMAPATGPARGPVPPPMTAPGTTPVNAPVTAPLPPPPPPPPTTTHPNYPSDGARK